MEIKIGTYLNEEGETVDILWNTELSFQEQTEQCQSKVVEIGNGAPDETTYEVKEGYNDRIDTQTFVKETFIESKKWEYMYPIDHKKAGLIKDFIFNIEEVA